MISITFIVLLILYFIYFYYIQDKIHIDEPEKIALPLGGGYLFTLIVGLSLYYILLYSKSYDKEYWGSYTVKAVHEESWNEYISQTCSYTTSDDKGNTTTNYYDCSYVRYNPEIWWIKDNINQRWSTNSEQYSQYKRRWMIEQKIGHHAGHTISGDIFEVDYDGYEHTLDPITTLHRYYNPINGSESVFKFKKISKEEAKKESLFDYPDANFYTSAVLGGGNCIELDRLNAKFGSEKQIRLWVLIYDNLPQSVGVLQKSYWKGGNKNELVTCIGLKDGKVDWCYVFSWSEQDDFLIDCRENIFSQYGRTLNLVDYANFLKKEIPEKWERKHFKDFNYISVNPSNTTLMSVFMVIVILGSIAPIFIIYSEDN